MTINVRKRRLIGKKKHQICAKKEIEKKPSIKYKKIDFSCCASL
jgi:hypothetical protein